MDALYTLFHFIVAIGILVAIHEFGHFWVARKAGVKVLRFSIGFGKVIWSYQQNKDATEYVISAIPLGGYVKMVDEREGEVAPADLPYAFNRQSLLARTAIVAAGPIFNLLLAVILFWLVLMMTQTGMRPIIGATQTETLAYQAGFVEGDEIISVNNTITPTWMEAMNLVFSSAMQGDEQLEIQVLNEDKITHTRILHFSADEEQTPESLYKQIGLKPWSPQLPAIIGKVIENSPAQQAGLQVDDLIISADNQAIDGWMQWVAYVKQRPEVTIQLMVDRAGLHLPIQITPEKIITETKDYGKIGAGVNIPTELIESLRVEHSLSPLDAFTAALKRTWFYSTSTLKMMGRMITGAASTDNLSGPISIAQYAGKSAERGLATFLKFLAMVSISLGVLNLLPVPVLDGGHLMFFAIEAIKGSPVSDKIQILFQQAGMFILMSLMIFAVFLDIGRLFS